MYTVARENPFANVSEYRFEFSLYLVLLSKESAEQPYLHIYIHEHVLRKIGKSNKKKSKTWNVKHSLFINAEIQYNP